MNVCLICLRPIARGRESYHPRCATRLFGFPQQPDTSEIDPVQFSESELHPVKGPRRLSLRPSLDVELSARGSLLPDASASAPFVLYPQSTSYPELPENESLTMALAELAGVEVQPHGLVALRNGSLALLVRRLDRIEGGCALHAGGFRELAEGSAGRPGVRTRAGSAESAADVVRRSTSEPLVALFKLFRLLVSAWWTGNGDVDLGALAIVTGPDDVRRLAPPARLASTRLLIPDDRLALSIAGKTEQLDRSDWVRFGASCGLRPRIVDRVLDAIVRSFDEALGLVSRAFISDNLKIAYAEMLGRHTARLEKR